MGVFSTTKVLADVATNVNPYTRRRRAVSTGSGGVSTASRLFSTAEESVSTAGASIPVSTAGMVQEVNIKDKEWENIRARVKADEEFTQRLQAEERNKYSFDELKELFETTMKNVNAFIPMETEDRERASELAAGSSQATITDSAEVGSSKRAAELELDHEVPVEEVYVKALHVKYPIIDWEVYSEDTRRYWRIIRDLVKERFSTTEPTYDKEKELWVDLKRLFEPDSDDTIWKLQRERLSIVKRSSDVDVVYQAKLVDLDKNHKFRGGLLGFKPITLSTAKGSVYTAKLRYTARVEDSTARRKLVLPLSENNIALIMRNKSDLDTLSMDDLYNNLKVYESEIKGKSSSSSNSQNVAFVSSDNSSSTNETVNTTHSVSGASSKDQASTELYADDVIFSFFTNQSNAPQAPRNQGYRNRDALRRNAPVDTSTTNALVVQDGIAVATKSGQVPVNAAKQSSPRAATSISTARPVNTAAPKPKLLDGKGQVLLKVPRHDNMYSFDLKNVVPSGGLTCLFVKATIDESNLWHKRLGHINFKTYDELVREGSGPDWLFDIDLLTNSMNYEPVTAGNQTNRNAGIKDNVDAVPTQQYILLPLLYDSPQSSKDAVADDAGKKTNEEPANKGERNGQEKEKSIIKKLMVDLLHLKEVLKEDTTDLLNTSIFSGAYDDEDEGAEADLNNLETTMNVSPIPITIIHKDHPKDQIIKDINSATKTRRMTKISKELVLVSYLNKQRKKNHKDYQNYLFAYFLSQKEPKKVIQALNDPSWIEAMQEELLQFKLQKKDERGIVVRNKARLVAQGYTQEEGIDYDEVFSPVARIEAIRLFLAYASFMGFIVYQMYVMSAFLYGTIEEEVYVCQPPGFEDPQFPDKVYKVEKALYGLHQAPRACHEEIHNKEVVNFLAKWLISWQCKKQTIVANSTTEAEYVAAANCRG
ncbi:putative ribonuclease H-like domain-containing protein [Tanacetum coccineum]